MPANRDLPFISSAAAPTVGDALAALAPLLMRHGARLHDRRPIGVEHLHLRDRHDACKTHALSLGAELDSYSSLRCEVVVVRTLLRKFFFRSCARV
jgi:hypothetical protein